MEDAQVLQLPTLLADRVVTLILGRQQLQELFKTQTANGFMFWDSHGNGF